VGIETAHQLDHRDPLGELHGFAVEIVVQQRAELGERVEDQGDTQGVIEQIEPETFAAGGLGIGEVQKVEEPTLDDSEQQPARLLEHGLSCR
jgi:hypothetical protein